MNKRTLLCALATSWLLAACGGGSTTAADTTPPVVSSFSVKGGATVAPGSDGSYAVAGDLGSTQTYTVVFSEKLAASSYPVQMLDSSNTLVALPGGMTATLIADDAGQQTYTLSVTTTGSLAFDAGQTSKAVKLQATVADAAQNSAKVNVTETVNDVAPMAAGAFAALTDMTISDNTGSKITPIQAGGVVDPLGRVIVYSATGLPPSTCAWWPGSALYADWRIDEMTGQIDGCYDAGSLENFTVTVTATPAGSSKSISKTFVLSIRDDG